MSDACEWTAAAVEDEFNEVATAVVQDAVEAYNNEEDVEGIPGSHESPEAAIREHAELYGVDLPPLAVIRYTPDINVTGLPLRQTSRDAVVRALASRSATVAIRERALQLLQDQYHYEKTTDTYERKTTAEL